MLNFKLQPRLTILLMAGFSTIAMAGNSYCPNEMQLFCPAHSQRCTSTGTIPSPWAFNSGSSNSKTDTDRTITLKFNHAVYINNPSSNYSTCNYKSTDAAHDAGGSLYDATNSFQAAYPGGFWQDTTAGLEYKNYRCPGQMYDSSIDPTNCPFR